MPGILKKAAVGFHVLIVSAALSNDEDPFDNTQSREIRVIRDYHDVAVIGVECVEHSESKQESAIVQIMNYGTDTERVYITL